MRKIFGRTGIYLILIAVLAGALRIARALQEERYSTDAYFYFRIAKDWARYGADYAYLYDVAHTPPLLPWTMALSYDLGLTPEYIALGLGILLGMLMPLGAFWAASNLFPEPNEKNRNFIIGGRYAYALLAAFLVAVHPFFIRISVSCLREILYLPLMVFGIASALSAIRHKSLVKWCLFAAFTALANLTRREGIIILGIFFAWQLVEFCVDRKAFLKDILYYFSSACCVSAVFLAITLPVMYGLSGSSCVWSPLLINLQAGGYGHYFIHFGLG
ncbi:MAG: hypothetical protein PHV82_00420 [Victivallaceae bacterium]|nr:hypothetical protein [Victivallaceae bacterium]